MVAFLSDLGASAARCLRLCSRVRTTNCCSGPGIGTRAKSFPREAEAAKIYSRENTRIQGAPPTGKKLFKPYPNLLCERSGYYGLPDPNIYERKCTSLSSCLQHWKADLCPKPKPDIFVYSLDDNLRKCFVAYSLEEDGIISPKYYIYPPSFLAKGNFFDGCSCDGLLHFHDNKLGHVLWNPTTTEYKILPKPFLELPPGLEYARVSFGLWSDPRFEDYKMLYTVKGSLEDEKLHFLGSSYHIHLYSLKTNSWKRLPCTEFGAFSGCACVSGVFYWRASLEHILSFDFSTETVSSLPAPNNNWNHFYFLEYKGLLSALECWDLESNFYPYVPWKFDLWVMRDGSWTRESVIETRAVKEPLWFSLDGKLLYFTSLTDELVVFDRDTGKLKYLGVNWPNTSITRPMMIPFYESFVQLN